MPGMARMKQVMCSVVKSTTKYWFIIVIDSVVPKGLRKAKFISGSKEYERFQGTIHGAKLLLYKRIREAKKKYPDLVLDVSVMVLPLGEADEKNITWAKGIEESMTKLARRVLYGHE